MKNLRGLKRAGALFLACVVLVLFSAGAYLQASEDGRFSAVSTGSGMILDESAGTQTVQDAAGSAEDTSEENDAEHRYEGQLISEPEFPAEKVGGIAETEAQTESAGETAGAEKQTETAAEAVGTEGQTETGGETAGTESQTEISGETAGTEGQTEISGETAGTEGQTETAEETAGAEEQTETIEETAGTEGQTETSDETAGTESQTETSGEAAGAEGQTEAAERYTETESASEGLPSQTEAETEEQTEDETERMVIRALEEAQQQDIDFLGLALGESVTFYVSLEQGNGIMPMALTEVTVTKTDTYKYADYGLGTGGTYTNRYVVSFKDITAVAYCIQPSRKAPDGGTDYKVEKLKDAKRLAKVCFYGSKSAGDEGFFAERHPKFSAGKRFIITHLAASYANGSSDAFDGANEEAQALAMELYEYCVRQPDIPEVDMELSKTDLTAYIDKDRDLERQRTESVTFKADSLQTITLKLPPGVILHNESTESESGAGESVTINGGTTFYLSAPLTQAQDVGAEWSSTMKGSIKKDYSAYKITTQKDEQNLALVFGDGVDEEAEVSLSVKWLDLISIEIIKNDEESQKGLQGAVFGVYADEDCTALIAEMPETDAEGKSSVTMVRTQDVVYLRELLPPKGYVINNQVVPLEIKGSELAFSYTMSDKRVKATIRLIKKDSVTDAPQGDATLEGAVYGVYAREDIVHPDGTTGVLFHAGDQVTSLRTDKDGKASVEGLCPGKYYVKEISPSNGYLVDAKEYDLVFESGDEGQTVIEKECISKEDVIRQPFQLIKVAGNEKSDTDLLEGAGFTAYLASSLKRKGDGTYDFASAAPVVLGANGETELFTDENGYAMSVPLPFGTYIVRETTVPSGFAPVADFEVRISENNPNKPQKWRVLVDDEFEAKLKIIKNDDETQRAVLEADTEFKVYDKDAGKYVEQMTYYPKEVKHTSYFTDEEGCLILPRSLPQGHYRIEEVTAPDGYTLGGNALEVTVDSNVAYRMDDASGEAMIEVVASNHPVKGQLKVIKKGPVLQGYDGKDFLYEDEPLANAVFEVYAAENIYTADCQKDSDGERILEYAEGDLAGVVTTDGNGEGTLENLPLGKYRVVEKTAPDGYVLNGEEQYVEFVYVDQNTPVVTERVEFVNELQKAEITVLKKSAEDGAVLAGAEFGLYAKEDVKLAGKTIVEADTLLAAAVTGEDGKAVFGRALPFGMYYVRELQAPAGFLPTEKTVDLTFSYEGQETEKVLLEATFENEPTRIEVTKADITTGVELDGASLSVLDKKGNVIDSWVSEKANPHIITGLHIGETYRLREELAPYGYLRAEEAEFTVLETGEVQKVRMEDSVPVGRIIISKTGEIVDSVTWNKVVAGTVDAVFGYISGSLREVVFEVYAAEDIKAADGESKDYYRKDELVATIATDALGYARSDDLPLGRYYVVEKKTAEGFVLDGEPREVDLTYRDQDTAVVLYDEKWQNSRQKAMVTVLKKEKGKDRALAGAVFALCAGEDIVGNDGKLLMKADTVIERKVTGDDGRLAFAADLPIGGSYYIKEVEAPAGYATTKKTEQFTFSYAGDGMQQVAFDFTFENKPTKVEVSKTDITTGEELPGARLQVRDENGKLVDSWTSGKKPHMIRGLEAGKTYTLREETAPKGYLIAEEVKFKVKDTGNIQSVVMKDAKEDNGVPKSGSAPKTGDNTKILPWTVLMAAAAGALLILTVLRKKKRLS